MIRSNYRSITVLPAAAKIHERLISVQMARKLSCLYISVDTQQTLVKCVEKCKSALDKNRFAGAILMGLSKAFDCLNHELLIA